MPSTSKGRESFPEGEATGKFEAEQLDKLVARSVEKSTVLKASPDPVSGDFVTAPYPAATPPAPSGPTPSSPEFLGKGSPVLVLPSEPPAPAASPVFAAAIAPPPPAAAAAVAVPAPPPVAPAPPPMGPAPAPAVQPAPAPTQPAAREATVVRSHRRISARATVKPRRRIWWRVIKLALLALVVLCQPWWWNVGDLNARPTPPTAPTAATK
jgi:hypothetical protein